LARTQPWRGHAFHQHRLLRKAQAFVAGEEEGLVLTVIKFGDTNRTAHVDAVVIEPESGYDGAERIARLQSRVLQILEHAAVETIRSALRDGGDVTDAAELGTVVRFADTNLGDRV